MPLDSAGVDEMGRVLERRPPDPAADVVGGGHIAVAGTLCCFCLDDFNHQRQSQLSQWFQN